MTAALTVVLLDSRRPGLVPVAAVGLLAGPLAYTEEVATVAGALPGARPVRDAPDAAVLLSSDRDHPAVAARLAAGAALITAPAPPTGERLLDAVAMMDRLRTDGPWERDQTHDSLRKFLLEETYELFDAIDALDGGDGGDGGELRTELGDVLLQVLFHARIAEESPAHPFTIDDVADALVQKLTGRSAGVLAGHRVTRADQLAQWEARKSVEKTRSSVTDGVPTGQPSLALAQQVIRRLDRAGFPADLLPEQIRQISVTADRDVDAELALRTAVLAFIAAVCDTERRILAEHGESGVAGRISEQQWRAAWSARSR